MAPLNYPSRMSTNRSSPRRALSLFGLLSPPSIPPPPPAFPGNSGRRRTTRRLKRLEPVKALRPRRPAEGGLRWRGEKGWTSFLFSFSFVDLSLSHIAPTRPCSPFGLRPDSPPFFQFFPTRDRFLLRETRHCIPLSTIRVERGQMCPPFRS